MRKRHAFTLVEMLVATALTMFIMAILSQAFVTSLEVFSQLKGIGDMEEGLRTAATLLRTDLAQDHFEGKRRLSDAAYYGTANNPYRPIFNNATLQSYVREGFFHIRQGGPSLIQGVDTEEGLANLPNNLLNSFISPNHVLCFTVKLRGNRPQDYFAAPVPLGPLAGNAATNNLNQPVDALYQSASTLNTQWVVVAYYLVPKGTTTNPSNPATPKGTPLYALYRYQAAIAPWNDPINTGRLPDGTPVPGAPLPGTDAYKYAGIGFVPQGALLPFAPQPQFAGNLFLTSPAELTHWLARPIDTSVIQPAAAFPFNFTFPVWQGTPYSPDGTARIAPIPAPPRVSLVVPPLPNSSSLVLPNVVSFNVRVLSDDVRPNPNAAEWGTPLRRVLRLTDFYDIDTYPPELLQPGNKTYPARWDTTLQAITDPSGAPAVTKTNPIVITSPGHGLTNANVGQPVYIHDVSGMNDSNGINLLGPITTLNPGPTPPPGLPLIAGIISPNQFAINRDGTDKPAFNYTVSNYAGGGTWSLNPIFRIKALQITIRVWDSKTRQARQLSILQEM